MATTPPRPRRTTRGASCRSRRSRPPYPTISDDEIRETIELHQLRLLRERGADLTIFSPRASAMEHHVGDGAVAAEWAGVCNDLIARVVELYPAHFAGVCQLPQTAAGGLKDHG
jgi:4-oxalmesaconate hydratase